MKSKTYYGEYSLMHWVNMMLNGDISLPDYQRSFVWHEKDIKRLLKSISDNQFIQPVTIALYPDVQTQKSKNPQIRNPTKVSERCGPNRQDCDFSSLD